VNYHRIAIGISPEPSSSRTRCSAFFHFLKGTPCRQPPPRQRRLGFGDNRIKSSVPFLVASFQTCLPLYHENCLLSSLRIPVLLLR